MCVCVCVSVCVCVCVCVCVFVVTSKYLNLNILYIKDCVYRDKCKGKGNPLQPWTGPEGSRRLRLPDFKTIGI